MLALFIGLLGLAFVTVVVVDIRVLRRRHSRTAGDSTAPALIEPEVAAHEVAGHEVAGPDAWYVLHLPPARRGADRREPRPERIASG